jgi:hypothetical protein
MATKVTRGVRHNIVHRNPGTKGGVWYECYREDCSAPATGILKTHSGASERACDEHAGVCHEGCWPS